MIVTVGKALTLVCAVAMASGPARGEPPDQAQLHYREGKRAFAAGDYAAAADSFSAAYRLSHDPAHLFNLAQARRLAGDCAPALAAYQEFLELKPDAPNRADVEAKIDSLEDCQPEETEAPAAAPAPPPRPREKGTIAAPLAMGGSPEQRDEEPEGPGRAGLWIAAGGGLSAAVGLLAVRSARDKQAELCRLSQDQSCNSPLLPGIEAQAEHLEAQMRTREMIALAALSVGVGLTAGGLIYHVVQVRKARHARSSARVRVGAAPVAGGGLVLMLGTLDL